MILARFLIALSCFFLIAGKTAQAARIASLNLCTDQLVLLLADRDDIVGLSPLSRDCFSSVMCAQAGTVPPLRLTAETVLSLRPDIVFAETYRQGLVLQAAREVGARVVVLDPVRSLDDIPRQIRLVAQAVGRPERGEALVRAFTQRLDRLSAVRTKAGPGAVIYEANGFVVHGHSLVDDVLRHAGLRNLTAMTAEGAHVPLERLLKIHPDLLVRDISGSGHSLAQTVLEHPALLASFQPPHLVNVPASLWLCGLPQTLDALAILRDARAKIEPYIP